MRKNAIIAALAVVMWILGTVTSANADSITFNFNSLSNNANNTSVKNYMNGVLGSVGSVSVTGALASKSYTGDGHVVGPCMKGGVVVSCSTSGASPISVTLATSDGTTQHLTTSDTFIQNVSSSSEITMTFSGFKIYSVSFDYEIFPDGTCADGRSNGKGGYKSCSSWPDFTFLADGTVMFNTLGVMPSSGPYSHSPNSTRTGTEQAPQYLGQSGTWTFANGVTKLEFQDWPATIGVDNLVFTTNKPIPPTVVPEPGALTLLGTGLLGLAGFVRRRLGTTR